MAQGNQTASMVAENLQDVCPGDLAGRSQTYFCPESAQCQRKRAQKSLLHGRSVRVPGQGHMGWAILFGLFLENIVVILSLSSSTLLPSKESCFFWLPLAIFVLKILPKWNFLPTFPS